jgi:hypothetical protein
LIQIRPNYSNEKLTEPLEMTFEEERFMFNEYKQRIEKSPVLDIFRI